MKIPTTLIQALLRQAALDLDLSVERDIEVIRYRCKHEGLEFLTITLPVLSDALERGLDDGLLTCPSGFARQGSLPHLLGGFFKRVFARDGKLLPCPCVESIYWIRQIARFLKKLKLPCKPFRNRKAVKHFIEVEGELRRDTSIVERKDNVLDSIAGIIWPRVFPEVDYLDLVCHHGPGVTADRRLSNERHRLCKWNDRSEHTYPSDLHCYSNYGIAAEESGRYGAGAEGSEGLLFLGVRDELPVRVVFVPKTLTTPRVIAIEPSHMQFMQQSLKDYMYEELETNSLTRHSIRFTDQGQNQRLAYRSSKDKRLATLDLKDASDRVHLHLVQRIFKTSGVLEYLEDARSLHATLPNGKNIVLSKYASMGSALCFPVEAMVFYTLIQSAMHQLDGIRPSSRSIKRYSRLIDIYGDDLIVPVEYSDTIVRYLESYLLKVNISKSFSKGNFRESCGADFFNGVSVKPVYASEMPHDDVRTWSAKTVMSWNAKADLFYMEGKWLVAQVIRDLLARAVRRPIPRAREPGSGLFHFSYLFNTRMHWNADLHCWKQKRIHYNPIYRKDCIDGDEIACLNKWGQRSSERSYRGLHSDIQTAARLRRADALLQSRHEIAECSPDDQCSLESSDPSVAAWFLERGLRQLPGHKEDAEGGYPSFPRMVSEGVALDKVPARHRRARTLSQNSRLDSSLDGLYNLRIIESSLDFDTSVKREGFKSKPRWVSLVG